MNAGVDEAGTPGQSREVRPIPTLIGLGAAALLLILPLGLSAHESRAAAVATLMAAWWLSEAVPLPVTALLPLALFPVLGVRTAKEMATAFADPAIFLFLGGFLLALAMEQQGLARRVAFRIAGSRVGARPALLVGALAAATFFLSAWINNTATTMILLPVAMAASVRSDTGTAKALILATAFFSSIGGIVTPIGTAPNVLFFGTAARLELTPPIGFLTWVAITLPVALVVAVAGWLILVAQFRVPWRKTDPTLVAEARAQHGELGRLTPGEARIAVLFTSAALLWISRENVTIGSFHWIGWSERLGLGAHVTDATVAMVIGLLVMLVSDGRGRSLLPWRDAERNLPWGMLLLLGGGFMLADGLQASGLAARIGHAVAALGGAPDAIVALGVAGSMTFLSELTSNTAQAGLVLPLMAASAEAIGAHPYTLMIPAVLACSLAFMMPAGTPPNAIAFATGRVRLPEMARAGLWFNLVAIVVNGLLTPILLRIFL